jgi:light-regulated signal transduction histidine kinase (bacteriophytochrome)
MRQVFLNLLSNASKFTRHREKAVIEIGELRDGDEPVIFVRDNGVGFEMRYADKLFQVFQHLHREEEFEGTGVGLAIVHLILQKHGGAIRAESTPQKGAAFFFTVSQPLPASPAPVATLDGKG